MTISVIDAAGNTQTVQTINDLVAGGMIVTIGSSVMSTVAVSSGVITPSSIVSVAPSSAISVTPSSVITVAQSGTVTVAGAVNVTAGSITLSSVATITPSSNPTVILSSNPTVTPSSALTVTPSSNYTVILSSNPTVILSSAVSITQTSAGANHYITAVSTTNPTIVSTSNTTLYGLSLQNISTTPMYLKLYSKATAATSVDTPRLTYIVPYSSQGAGALVPMPNAGISFPTGLGFRTTANSSDDDNTAPAASIVLNFYWS